MLYCIINRIRGVAINKKQSFDSNRECYSIPKEESLNVVVFSLSPISSARYRLGNAFGKGSVGNNMQVKSDSESSRVEDNMNGIESERCMFEVIYNNLQAEERFTHWQCTEKAGKKSGIYLFLQH
jgi:hypothetical protein